MLYSVGRRWRQHRCQRFFGAGLANAAGNADDIDREATAIRSRRHVVGWRADRRPPPAPAVPGQGRRDQPRCGSPADPGSAVLGDPPFTNQRRSCTTTQRVCHKAMAINLLTGQGHKQITRTCQPRVRSRPARTGVLAHQLARRASLPPALPTRSARVITNSFHNPNALSF